MDRTENTIEQGGAGARRGDSSLAGQARQGGKNSRFGSPAHDPLRLRIQVEALLLDPRGHFRPRTLTLQTPGGDEMLVVQVGEQQDGTLSIVTPEPLAPGERFRVLPLDAAPTQPGRRCTLRVCRPGHRPGDAALDCWISELEPVSEPGVEACAHDPEPLSLLPLDAPPRSHGA